MNRNKWSKWGAHACSLVFFIFVVWAWQYLSDLRVWKPYLDRKSVVEGKSVN